MKTKLNILAATCAATLCASAATIATVPINNATASNTANSGFTVSFATVGMTTTYTYTQTGDLDGEGISDDTLSFDLVVNTYTGSTYDGADVTLGLASTPNTSNVNWHSNGFNDGNTISFEIANIVYTDGEGDGAALFDGFTAIQLTNYNATPAGDIDYYVGTTGATTVTGDPTFQADLTSNGTASQVFFTASDGPARLRNLDFQFCIVPEPSSVVLLGLGMTGFLVRRRA